MSLNSHTRSRWLSLLKYTKAQFRGPAALLYSTFLLASLLKLGMFISVIIALFDSISAAHKAAPTRSYQLLAQNIAEENIAIPVFVKENRIEAKGMSSSSVATVPNLDLD